MMELKQRSVMLFLLNTVIFVTKEATGVSLQAVVVPHSKTRGENADLLCKYTQDGMDKLYSLKWYKDEVEFYRYQPWVQSGNKVVVFSVPGVRVDSSLSRPEHVVIKKVNFLSSGVYRCEITSNNFKIIEKYEQMTVVALPHKAPTISATQENRQYEIGDLLELNCTSEPSHPPSALKWEINKRPVNEDFVTFRKKFHVGRKLTVTQIGLNIRLHKTHFHWGKLKVACIGEVKAVFWKQGVTELFTKPVETEIQVLESMEGYWIGNTSSVIIADCSLLLFLYISRIFFVYSSP